MVHGALPGDTIPVKVKVEHSRAARGIVIATLYRQGRIDMLPSLPLVSRGKDKKPEYEDVYPKSKTGLGGLYFTKGAPNMAFRKDLTQTSTVMIVDPQTKTADLRFNVQVPNDAFPTIDNIPGGMIHAVDKTMRLSVISIAMREESADGVARSLGMATSAIPTSTLHATSPYRYEKR